MLGLSELGFGAREGEFHVLHFQPGDQSQFVSVTRGAPILLRHLHLFFPNREAGLGGIQLDPGLAHLQLHLEIDQLGGGFRLGNLGARALQLMLRAPSVE